MVVAAVLALLGPRIDAGRVDPFYRRFTSGPASSLIIGSSRAAQGLQPRVLAPALLGRGRYQGPMLNFAFTITNSPYGPAYLAQIKKKVAAHTRNGVFLLAVDPWVLSCDSTERQDQRLREDKSFMSKLHAAALNPNIEYILRFGDRPLYQLFAVPPLKNYDIYLHADGWLEMTVPLDSASVQERTSRGMRRYRSFVNHWQLSDVRMQALRQTITFLQQHGQVYLLRLPAGVGMKQMEQQHWPDFDSLMQRQAEAFRVPYLSYMALSAAYPTTDGNHLQSEAGRRLSRKIAADILKLNGAHMARQK
ncbi:hypothetical protein [Hymenobacter koreensis]|uniref:hypothetical protein n=1 Tax=Hymenobacter koreensis TaxID=1084523 RepID=UPI0031EFB767